MIYDASTGNEIKQLLVLLRASHGQVDSVTWASKTDLVRSPFPPVRWVQGPVQGYTDDKRQHDAVLPVDTRCSELQRDGVDCAGAILERVGPDEEVRGGGVWGFGGDRLQIMTSIWRDPIETGDSGSCNPVGLCLGRDYFIAADNKSMRRASVPTEK